MKEVRVYISKEALNSKGFGYFVQLFESERLDDKVSAGFKSIDGLKIMVDYGDIYLAKSKKDTMFDTLRGWDEWLSTQF